jgi:hypothetical protein
MIDFFDDLHREKPDEHNYIFFFYREENLFPAIVFGNIRDQANDKSISDCIEVDFCLPEPYNSNFDDNSRKHGRIMCREAGTADLDALETILLAKGQLPYFRFEGLSRESICALSLETEYRRLGLYRFRKVFVSEDGETGARCFAVANFSSPGLNFSELNNSFRAFYSNDDGAVNQQLINAVAPVVLDAFVATGILKPVMLCTQGQPVPAKFEKTKRYQYFYFNIRRMDHFRSVTAESIGAMKSHLRTRIRQESAKIS